MAVAAERAVVSDDATLDAFARDSGSERDDSADDAPAVEPAAVTSSWGADGTCEACGEPASRRWLDGGERVCGACKQWS